MFVSYLPLLLTVLVPIVCAVEDVKNEHNGGLLRNVLFSKSEENVKPAADDVKLKKSTMDPLSLRFDLADFSDDELIRLSEVLQEELEKYDVTEEPVSKLAAEPLVLIPSELVNKPKKVHSRSRRSKPHGKMILAQAFPAELLQRLTQSEPIIVLPEIDEEFKQSGPAYITVKESAAEQMDPLPLTASEIDELELRTRVAQLADLLRERALRGL